MASEKLKLANKKNAQLSSGPKTSAGKAIASLNSIKHGLTSRTEFDSVSGLKIYRGLLEEYGADTPSRKFLVQQLALTMVRLERCARMESEIIAEAIDPPVIEEVLEEGVEELSKMVKTHEGTPATISPVYFKRLAELDERYGSKLTRRAMRLMQELRRTASF